MSAGSWSASQGPSGPARREWLNDAVDTALFAAVIVLLVLVAVV
jgi:hypothetical protein